MGSVAFSLEDVVIEASTTPPSYSPSSPPRRRAATVSNSQVGLINRLARTRVSHVVCFFLAPGRHVVSMEVRVDGPSARYFIHLPHFSFMIKLRWRMTSMGPEILRFRASANRGSFGLGEDDLEYLGGVAYTRPCSDRMFGVLRSKVYVVGRDELRRCDGVQEAPRESCVEREGILV
ncbi:hypothetical protein A1O7_07403 [Cladophialophora yegresii CBS 114405]|uniref:Uncharacterized protein n=1 Tax=Cladophialophora yegresii CBS 114405 TaxID=1182544 RepID=W9WEV7_9EURO|nr:uncharacterized protein A1O7_07403 [Cladophialophora yegresii CBS 114405]EXJ57059.1 hypothetical protein A1O7_07403 [Cladophialophora yegresii CBS 114405]